MYQEVIAILVAGMASRTLWKAYKEATLPSPPIVLGNGNYAFVDSRWPNNP